MAAEEVQPKPRVHRVLTIALLGTAALIVMLYPAARLHLRAASLLLRIQDPHATGVIARFSTFPVEETLTEIETRNGPVPARLYRPRGPADPPGMVVLHGVHHLGIEEPRLISFSRALAASGIAVLTPELKSLADYRVSPRDLPVIGAAAQDLHRRTGHRVGVLGLSFAGGLALLVAADPQWSPDIGFVFAIGAHDSLERVCRYLATGRALRPDGTYLDLPAHEYGALVLLYAHPEDFFTPGDVAAARTAIQLQLWQQTDAAQRSLTKLTPGGRSLLLLLFDHRRDHVAGDLLRHLPMHRSEMAQVSPEGHLQNLRVPVLLLHGAGDNVIPPTETKWLATQVPRPLLRKVLISPLLTHVELDRRTSWRDKLALLEFMTAMLGEVSKLKNEE